MGACGNPNCNLAYPPHIEGNDPHCGMAPKPFTMRDQFAMAALAAIPWISHMGIALDHEGVAKHVYLIADHMLKEREKK